MIAPEPLDDLSRLRSAIDQVAEEDDAGARLATGAVVGLDPEQKLVEQIKPSMDVADRVGAMPTRGRGPATTSDKASAPDHLPSQARQQNSPGEFGRAPARILAPSTLSHCR